MVTGAVPKPQTKLLWNDRERESVHSKSYSNSTSSLVISEEGIIDSAIIDQTNDGHDPFDRTFDNGLKLPNANIYETDGHIIQASHITQTLPSHYGLPIAYPSKELQLHTVEHAFCPVEQIAVVGVTKPVKYGQRPSNKSLISADDNVEINTSTITESHDQDLLNKKRKVIESTKKDCGSAYCLIDTEEGSIHSYNTPKVPFIKSILRYIMVAICITGILIGVGVLYYKLEEDLQYQQ